MKLRLKHLFIKKNKKEPDLNVDNQMKNLVNSMFLCDPLYDKLKVKCHPDRFLEETNRINAEQLFQELQKNRYDYDRMLEIEKRVNLLIEANKN